MKNFPVAVGRPESFSDDVIKRYRSCCICRRRYDTDIWRNCRVTHLYRVGVLRTSSQTAVGVAWRCLPPAVGSTGIAGYLNEVVLNRTGIIDSRRRSHRDLCVAYGNRKYIKCCRIRRRRQIGLLVSCCIGRARSCTGV